MSKGRNPMSEDDIRLLIAAMKMQPLASDRYSIAANTLNNRHLTCQQAGTLLEALQHGILQMRFAQRVLQEKLIDHDESLLVSRAFSVPLKRSIAAIVGVSGHAELSWQAPKPQVPPPVRGIDVCTPRNDPPALDAPSSLNGLIANSFKLRGMPPTSTMGRFPDCNSRPALLEEHISLRDAYSLRPAVSSCRRSASKKGGSTMPESNDTSARRLAAEQNLQLGASSLEVQLSNSITISPDPVSDLHRQGVATSAAERPSQAYPDTARRQSRKIYASAPEIDRIDSAVLDAVVQGKSLPDL